MPSLGRMCFNQTFGKKNVHTSPATRYSSSRLSLQRWSLSDDTNDTFFFFFLQKGSGGLLLTKVILH